MSDFSPGEYFGEPPRALPLEGAFLLGSYAQEEGFVQFLFDLRDDGFFLWEAKDNELTRDEWEALALSRVNTIVTAWHIYQEKLNAR